MHGLINDFHEWTAWSPWEDLDPELSRDYSGPDTGVGARYAWQGNRKAGQGSMEITGSDAGAIDLRLLFVKPWKADNKVDFTLTPGDAGTEVTWRMTGEQSGLQALFTKLFNHGQAGRQGLREGPGPAQGGRRADRLTTTPWCTPGGSAKRP